MSGVKSPVKIQPLLQPVSLLILPSPVSTDGSTSLQQTVLPYFITTSAVTVSKKQTPTIRPARKYRDEPTEILRCKRRLEFRYHKEQSATTVRRNERERNRVRQINSTFSILRDHLPSSLTGPKTKKVSKVDTLKGAIQYINHLQQMLDDHDAVTAALGNQKFPPPLSPTDSVGATAASPSSTSSGSDSAYDSPLSPGERDLLDFNSWFD